MFIWTAWALLRNSRFGCSGEQNIEIQRQMEQGEWVTRREGEWHGPSKQTLISFSFLMREHILSVSKSLKEDPAEKPKLLFRRFVFTVAFRVLLS